MKNLSTLDTILKRLAVDDVIGDPKGLPAAAYIRVSSEEQAKEGRDGLPRQIEHINEVALKAGYRISLKDIYADDDSGFEYEYRIGLNNLRRDYNQHRFSAVVMEHLDRLARTGWHQGLLLHEMKTKKLSPVFWKEFSSEIERAVMGAISEQGMQQSKERMKSGTQSKARDGRVTARTPAFGYRFVDKHGNESAESRRHTYYAVYEPEAFIVRAAFSKIAYEGMSLRAVALYLRNQHTSKTWDGSKVQRLITNRLYMGEFIHGRMEAVKTPKYDSVGNYIGMGIHHKERSEEEWIRVTVPSIVDVRVWNDAQQALEKNSIMATRNAKNEYLLTGLVKCAHCGCSLSASISRGQNRESMSYRCSKKNNDKADCPQKNIVTHKLDSAVWQAVISILLDPKLILESLDRKLTTGRNEQLQTELDYIKSKLAELPTRDHKLELAYEAGAYDAKEFAAKRKLLRLEQTQFEEQYRLLSSKVVTPDQIEEQKQHLLSMCNRARDMNLTHEIPLAAKKRILKLMVNRVIVDTVAGILTIEGIINLDVNIDYVRSQP